MINSAAPPPRDRWGRLPFFGVVLIPALGLCLIGEHFPYSPFPMYSSFGKYTTVHYLTDANHQPVPCQSLVGLNSARLKKTFNTELSKALRQSSSREKAEDFDSIENNAGTAEVRSETAKRLLTRLVQARSSKKRKPPMPPVLRYVVKRLGMEQGKYTEQETVLAEISTGGPEPKP